MSEEIDIVLTFENLHGFYTSYFAYYKTLSAKWQQLFNERCIQFIAEKNIIGAEGFEPNNKVKAIIAACAVQLTLGLETWDFNYFETIIVHPSDFDDKASGLKFRGETNLAGFIRLSWKGFISGYKIGDDNINLGLHEFMHALRFSAVKGDIQDYFVDNYFNKWQAAAMEAYYDTKNNRETIFRKYGGVNINEFISVCVEHYFESPEDIKKEYPQLYYCTAILLNQQTQNKITELDVREKLLKESNALQTDFSDKTLRAVPFKSTALVVATIIAMPLLYTVFETSLYSGGTIFLIILFLIAYVQFDAKYTKISFSKKEMQVSKGFLIFKNWQKFYIPLSGIISMRVYNNNELDNEWEIVFYNAKNESFYEETIPTHQPIDPAFVKEIIANKIAWFKS